jgi:hypothetical protein
MIKWYFQQTRGAAVAGKFEFITKKSVAPGDEIEVDGIPARVLATHAEFGIHYEVPIPGLNTSARDWLPWDQIVQARVI